MTPDELKAMLECLKIIEKVREYRLKSTSKPTRKLAEKPTRFKRENLPKNPYLVIPEISFEIRKYIPIGFISPDIMLSNLVKVIENATLYHFGILASSVHNAWMRLVAGRLEMRYRYSKQFVYNNYPWPEVIEKQKQNIEYLAKVTLDTRLKYPPSSLADLYVPLTMPKDLLIAHQKLDKAVLPLIWIIGKYQGKRYSRTFA